MNTNNYLPFFDPVSDTTYSLPGLTSNAFPPARSFTNAWTVSYTINNAGAIESNETGRMAGAGARDVGSPGVNNDTPAMGFTTATGTAVRIDNSNGQETVTLSHFTGASIMIDADGSIHLVPTGSKGFNLNAARGTGLIYAHGDLVMKSGTKIFLESASNLEMNVGGDFLLNVEGNFIKRIFGSEQDTVNGNRATETTQDRIETIAGEHRTTVAGNSRTQVTGSMRQDVGRDFDTRVQQTMNMSSQQAGSFQSKNDVMIQSTGGSITVNSGEDTFIQSQKSARIIADSSVSLDSKSGGIYQRSQSEVVVSAKSNINLDSESTLTLRTDSFRIDGETTVDIRGDNIKMSGPSTVDIRGSRLDLNKGAPEGVGSKQTTTPRTPVAPEAFDGPEFADANTIIDALTTQREAPDFPNMAGRNAETIGYYQNEGGQIPPRLQSEASSNPSVGPQGDARDGNYSVGENQQAPPENTSVATQNPLPVPSRHDRSSKISKHVTMGQYFRDYHISDPQHILNAMNLCHNIVDPLIDEFSGNRGVPLHVALVPGAGYREGSGRSNHYRGLAIDVQPHALKDYDLGFEIAEWVYQNLPWSGILLEISRGGNTLIHFESAQPGSGAGGKLLTCKNNTCTVNVPGLSYSQYFEYLRQRGLV